MFSRERILSDVGEVLKDNGEVEGDGNGVGCGYVRFLRG